MKKVMCFGTFDLLHPGHLSYLKQAREYGEYLIVVVARDENILKNKEREPIDNLKKRIKNLELSGLADEVIAGSLEDKYQVVRAHQPDTICLGYDQVVSLEKLKQIFFGKIIRLKSFEPQIYKSSKLRAKKKS